MNNIAPDDSMPKWVNAWTPELVKLWLEYSPAEPGPMAANLRGFIINNHFYCTRCCGRLNGRGIILPRESRPVWLDGIPAHPVCAACGNMVPNPNVPYPTPNE